MDEYATCRHCGEEIYPSEGRWRNTAFNGRDPQFYCASPRRSIHAPVSESAAEPAGPVDDIDESLRVSARTDRKALARELVAGLRSNGEGCTCEAWAAMECGCPDARWPERYILDAADLIEAMVNDDVAETPQDTAIITLSREDAEAFQDPDGNWIEGCLERLADACRAELEVER